MLPFDHLGPYRIGEPIGRGGMGAVFKAVHEKTGEEVAVKVIAASVSDDMRFRRRFDAEIKTLIKLKHPNIVSLIGAGEQHGQLFYSMELVNGESLQQRLRREKRLAWPFVLDMGIEVCNALKHAHNFGVVHRDLKPANLLIADNGSTKLVDFGIAKLYGSADQTAAGSVLGTADFMAPEQANGGPITPRTDLYALGNVLYACFAGRPPFAGRTMTRVIESLQRETPAPLDLIAPDVPVEIVQLVHNLLEKVPDERPPTALAVMNRMKAIRAGLQRQAELSESLKTPVRQLPHPDSNQPLDQPTKGQGADTGETPTVVAEDAIVRRTALPQNDLTMQESASVVNPRTSSTHRDEDYALTGESVRPDRSAVKSGSGVKQGTGAASASPTMVSGAAAKVDSPSIETQPTHFNTVQEHQRRRGLWEQDDDEVKTNQWGQLLSIAALVSVLIGAAGLFLWSMRRPSAEDLYQSILASQARDDQTTFRSQLDQFKRLYPDDARSEELEPFLDELDSAKIMRRLRLAAVHEGGDDHLAPYQQSFLEAMRDVEHDPAKTRTMLRHWLDVYDPPVNTTNDAHLPELKSISRAAKQELQRLSVKSIPPGDARAEELIRRIEWASQSLEKSDLRKMLQGIESLYGDKPWAVPAIETARQRLTELQQ